MKAEDVHKEIAERTSALDAIEKELAAATCSNECLNIGQHLKNERAGTAHFFCFTDIPDELRNEAKEKILWRITNLEANARKKESIFRKTGQ